MKFATSTEFLAKLNEIGWFDGMPEEACEYIKKAAILAERNNWEYSPWPESRQYTPLNLLIGEHFLDLLKDSFQKASYGVFETENLNVEEVPIEYQDYNSFKVILSFTLNGKEYVGRIKTSHSDQLDFDFLDLINKAMYEQTNGLCFEEISEAYGTIALANKQAVNKAKNLGIIPDYKQYWQKFEINSNSNYNNEINEKSKNWRVERNVSIKKFYRNEIDISISELTLIKSDNSSSSGLLNEIIGFFDNLIVTDTKIFFGADFSMHNDVSKSGAYLEFDNSYLEVFNYNSDGADEEEIRFNAKVIFYSKYTMDGKEDDEKSFSNEAIEWANRMLLHLGLKKGGKSFQNFCINYLELPVGWIQKIFYNESYRFNEEDRKVEDIIEVELPKIEPVSTAVENDEGTEELEKTIQEPLYSTEELSDPEKYLLQLEQFGWYKFLPEKAISEVKETVQYNYQNKESFSPWPIGIPLPEYKDHIGDYTAILLTASSVSNGYFIPENIIEKRDLPLTQETSHISFDLGKDHIEFEIPFNTDFLNILNENIIGCCNGQGFVILSSNKSFICPVNQYALKSVEENNIPISFKPNYRNFSKKGLKLDQHGKEEKELPLYDKLREMGKYTSDVLTKHMNGYDVHLNSLKFIAKDGTHKEILFGSGGESYGESDTTVAYLSYSYGRITSYSRQTDHVNHSELCYNGSIVHKSYFTAAGDDDFFTYPEGAYWANELLQFLGMSEGKESFKELLTYGLSLGVLAAHTDYMFEESENNPNKPDNLIASLKKHKLKFMPKFDSQKSNRGHTFFIHQFTFRDHNKSTIKIKYGNYYIDKGDDLFIYGGKLVFNNSSFEYYKEQQYQNDRNESRYFEEFYFENKLIAKVNHGDSFEEIKNKIDTSKIEYWVFELLQAINYENDLKIFINMLNDDFEWETKFLKAVLLDEPDLDLWQLFEQKATFKKQFKTKKSCKNGIKVNLNSYELAKSFAGDVDRKIEFGSNYDIMADETKPELIYSIIKYGDHKAESFVKHDFQELYFDEKRIYFRDKNGNHKNWEITYSPKAIEWAHNLLDLLRLNKVPASYNHLPYVLNIDTDVFDKLFCGDPNLNHEISYNYFK